MRPELGSWIWDYPGNFKVNPGFAVLQSPFTSYLYLLVIVAMVTYPADLIQVVDQQV